MRSLHPQSLCQQAPIKRSACAGSSGSMDDEIHESARFSRQALQRETSRPSLYILAIV